MLFIFGPIFIKILSIIFKTIPLFLIFSLFIWTLARYDERSFEKINAEYKNRFQQTIGFEDNSDFYDLDIYLDLYLQWALSFITNWFTSIKCEPVIAAYVIFSISITVAILARVFGQQCTFVAEIFVVLTMFWDDLNILIVLLLRGPTLDGLISIFIRERDTEDILKRFKTSEGLKWSSSLLNFFMSPIILWFWERLAAMGQQDFAPISGYTSLFFFAQIQEQDIKALSIFMTVVSAINFLWFNYLLLPLRIDPDLWNGSLESLLNELIWASLHLFLISLWIFYNLVSILSTGLVIALTLDLKVLTWMIARVRNFDVINSIDLGSQNLPDTVTEKQVLDIIR